MNNQDFLEKISLDGEEWRDVVGYEGLYAVSNFGRVCALNRYSRNNQGICSLKAKLKSPRPLPNGYLQVNLWKNNKGLNRYVHRLVAEAFIPNPHNYPQTDHIDTDRTNNRVDNLRWVTCTENHLNPITRKRNSKSKKGNRTLIEKMSKAVVRINPNNPKDIKIYPSAKAAGESEGFNWSHIGDVCRGERSKTQGYYWKFLSDYESSKSVSQCSLVAR